MLDAQNSYGPDARFLWHDHDIAMGGNRLDLLPEDRYDSQPLWAPGRSCCLVADVRLDNRDELAGELGLTEPERLSDATILMHCWLRWGEGCLDHILGGFAFAVWTPGRQELFAARDHTGERPLFYSRGGDQFALASMPEGLLCLPGVGAGGVKESRIVDWMSLNQPDWGASFYGKIERLPLGHFLRAQPDKFECKSYWHPCDAKPVRYKKDADYAEAFVEILDRAMAPRLRSTGEIGAQLSAGLDSSTVAASAALLLAREGRGLTAFTHIPQPGFLGKGYAGRLEDEWPGAAEVASLYPNMDHVGVHTAGRDLVADMKAWARTSGEPAPNLINLLWISGILERAREGNVRVMLQGVFGNSTFSQEGRDNLQTWFRHGRWLKLFRLANSLRNNGDTSFKASIVFATNGFLPMGIKRRLRPSMRSFNLDTSALTPELSSRYDLLNRGFQRLHADLPDLRGQRRLFFERYDFGPINNAMRARYGIDPRDPSSDRRVFEFCFGIPAEQYVVGYQSRSLVRRAMKGRLPENTLKRYIRGQQGVDAAMTLQRALPSLREELALQQKSPLARQYVDLPRLQGIVDNWPEQGYQGDEDDSSWHYALTRGISLGYFLRNFEQSSAKG